MFCRMVLLNFQREEAQQPQQKAQVLKEETAPTNKKSSLCRTDQFLPGRWIAYNRTEKTYVSCGSFANDYLDVEIKDKCNASTWHDQWGRGPHSGLTLIGGHASVCDEADRTRRIPSLREQFQWKPDQCDLLAWDPLLFCKLLGRRKIHFLGDSTMQQTFASFVNLINSQKEGYSQELLCAEQLSFSALHGLYQHYEQEVESWDNTIHRFEPDIIVIGFGAHYTHFGTHFEVFEQSIHTMFELFNHTLIERKGRLGGGGAQRKQQLHLVWKTNNPGHVECDKYKGPNAVYSDHLNAAKDKYKWAYFPHYDALYQNVSMLEKYKHLIGKTSVLDVGALYFRADSHPGMRAWDWMKIWGGDCLHYCSPGALDLIPVLFLHTLLFDLP
eukprot:gene1813-1981_t